MKKIIISILLATVLSYLMINAVLHFENNVICDNFVRIHIIANSDEPYDQIVKMGVRNHIFTKFKNEFSTISSKDAEIKYINNNINLISDEVNNYLENIGYSNKAAVKITFENFPAKVYEKFLLPEGNYNALKIVIGSGMGKNFFCVMYPPLCVSENVRIEKNVKTNTSKKYTVNYESRIANVFNHILR